MVLDDFMCRWRRMAAESFKTPDKGGLFFKVRRREIGEIGDDGPKLNVQICVVGNNFVVAEGIPDTIYAFGSVLYLADTDDLGSDTSKISAVGGAADFNKMLTQNCITYGDGREVDHDQSITKFLNQGKNGVIVQYNKSIFYEALQSPNERIKTALTKTRKENPKELVELICDYWTSDLVVEALSPITSNSSAFLSKHDLITRNEYVYATEVSNKRKTDSVQTLTNNNWIEKVVFDLIRLISELSLVVRRKAFVQAFGAMDGTTSVGANSKPTNKYVEALSFLVLLLAAALKGTAYAFEMLKTRNQKNPQKGYSVDFTEKISEQKAVFEKTRERFCGFDSEKSLDLENMVKSTGLCFYGDWMAEATTGIDNIQNSQQGPTASSSED